MSIAHLDILIVFFMIPLCLKVLVCFVQKMMNNMEVAVFMSLDAYKANKSVFQRNVLCPDAFNPSAFVSVMKSIFGEKAVISITVV